MSENFLWLSRVVQDDYEIHDSRHQGLMGKHFYTNGGSYYQYRREEQTNFRKLDVMLCSAVDETTEIFNLLARVEKYFKNSLFWNQLSNNFGLCIIWRLPASHDTLRKTMFFLLSRSFHFNHFDTSASLFSFIAV